MLDCDRRIAILKTDDTKHPIDLTQKEFQLLQYFMEHPNQILSRDQVLNQLWEIGAEPNSQQRRSGPNAAAATQIGPTWL